MSTSPTNDWRAAIAIALRSGELPADAAAHAEELLHSRPGEEPSTEAIAARLGLPVDRVRALLDRARAQPPTMPLTPATDGPAGWPFQHADSSTAAAHAETVSLGGSPPPAAAPRRLGPYLLLDILGQGGMGVVHRARHEKLGTICAVKLLHAGAHASAEALARFRREAAAVARMGKHPNIVAVYDLDEQDGQAYFAMECVTGQPLSRVLRERTLPPPEAARLVEKVARAIHFAHERGIIHRDIKPGNILLRADGEPQVTDFGLAHDVRAEERLSSEGQVMGTLAYMSPEQASGEVDSVDARSDVYALGGVLYEMLTGVPPHASQAPVKTLQAILAGAVVPPRQLRPDIPRDLETIALKCLSLEPAGRYATAADLADDLARWMRHEPVRARPVGLLGRLARRARRQPLVASLLVALVLASGAAGAGAWRSASRERELLVELSLSGETLVDAALARRAIGDMEGASHHAARLADPVARLKALAPALAEPWYYEGRMARAMGREQDALAAQDRAVGLARAPGASEGSRALLPLALYERGVLRAQAYEAAKEERTLSMFIDPAGSARPLSAAAQAEYAGIRDLEPLRDGALSDLSEAAGSLEGARGFVARGLAAFLRRDWKEAEADLTRAIASDRYLEEAYSALAGTALARDDTEAARRWYAKGHDADRGHLPHLLGLGMADWHLSDAAEARGEDGSEGRRSALASLDQAAAIDPRRADVWDGESHVWCSEVDALERRGKAPESALAKAAEASTRAVAIAPRDEYALQESGYVLLLDGEWRMTRGEDPTEPLKKALEVYARAIGLRPDYPIAIGNEAMVHHALAKWEILRGGDPAAEFARAEEGYRRAAQVDPQFHQAETNLGLVYLQRGSHAQARGGDPSADWDQAIAAFGRVLQTEPSSVEAASNLGLAHAWRAERAARAGKDPGVEVEAALAAFDRAIAIDPNRAEVLSNRADALHTRIAWRMARGEDASADVGRAVEGYERALAANPLFWSAAIDLGMLHDEVGEAQGFADKDPRDEFAKALAAFARAEKGAPQNATASWRSGAVHLMLWQWARHTGQPAKAELEAALASYDKAIALEPEEIYALAGRGAVLRELGRVDESIAGLEAALARHPGDATISAQLQESRLARDASKGSDRLAEFLAKGEELTTKGEYAEAGKAYAAGLDLLEKEWAPLTDEDRRAKLAIPEVRTVLATARYNLACIRAQASAGKDGPKGPAKPIEAAESARLRDDAFDLLSKAADAGLSDPDMMEKDTDLTPLVGDPRWKPLLARIRTNGGK